MIIGGKDKTNSFYSDVTIENLDVCSYCGGSCCKTMDIVIPLSNSELIRIPPSLTTQLEDLPIIKRTKNGCLALTDEGCSIFDVRPFFCRIYPIKLLSFSESIYFDSYLFSGYTFVLNNCKLSDHIDFEKSIDNILKHLERDTVYFDRLKKVASKYEEMNPASYIVQCYSKYRFIEK